MYLLDTRAVRLCFYPTCDAAPPFAILSHVWGPHEQTFQEVQNIMKAPSADGEQRLSQKIRDCCRFARKLGFDWVWVDTCCINKESSAELVEAISSMFVWYGRAQRCLAYLEDVPDDNDVEDSLAKSRWFKRGWTLQELIAPRNVIFLSRTWTQLGTKKDLAHILHRITGIDVRVLTFECDVMDISVGQRLSWAADRETTRIEDEAYCLMGVLGIHVPIIYGEGRAAFRRLQEEILKRTPDQTLFAWENDASFDTAKLGLLAPSPSLFRSSGELRHLPADKLQDAIRVFMKALGGDGFAGSDVHTFSVTNIGTLARLPIIECEGTEAIALGVLAVQRGDFYVSLVLNRTGAFGSVPLYSCGGNRRLGDRVRTLQNNQVHGELLALWEEPGSGKPHVSWKEVYLLDTNFRALDDSRHDRLHLQPSLTVSIPPWVLSDLTTSGFTSADIDPSECQQPVRIFPPVRQGHTSAPLAPTMPRNLAPRTRSSPYPRPHPISISDPVQGDGNDGAPAAVMCICFAYSRTRGYDEDTGHKEGFTLKLQLTTAGDGRGLRAGVTILPDQSSLETELVANWPGGGRTFFQQGGDAERSLELRFVETQGTSDLWLEIVLGGEVYLRLRAEAGMEAGMEAVAGGCMTLLKANRKEKDRQDQEKREKASLVLPE